MAQKKKKKNQTKKKTPKPKKSYQTFKLIGFGDRGTVRRQVHTGPQHPSSFGGPSYPDVTNF